MIEKDKKNHKSEDKKNLGQVFYETKRQLEKAGHEQAVLEARILLEWATKTTYKDILITPEKTVDDLSCQTLKQAVERCKRGESVHRIVGFREFYGLKFFLSPSTLEPRPDTEVLVDLILPFIKQLAKEKTSVNLLDMGTGSGAIAIALLFECPQLHGVGVDIAQDALDMAVKNAKNCGVAARFTPLKSDWFSQVIGHYDVIVSNPPYIKTEDIAGLDKNVRDFDPFLALDGGEDGLQFYRKLAQQASSFLTNKGIVVVEIGQGQERQVEKIFAEENYQLIEKNRDLNGIIRALLFQK